MADNHLMCAAKLALLTDREAAHHLIQDFSDADANWLHAVLHKIEGDWVFWPIMTSHSGLS